MSHLSKYLNKKVVLTFLENAEKCFFMHGDALYLEDDEGKTIFHFGNATDTISASLILEGKTLGKLYGHFHSPGALEFLRFGLQTIIDVEYARRSVASETLEQYRELALLQRAALSLNDSLEPRLVARALLALLHEDKQESRTIGACYASAGDKKSNLLALAVQGCDEAALDDVAGSSLVKDVVKRGRAEIFNRLDKDPRWLVRGSPCQHLLVAPIIASEATVGLLLLARIRGESEFLASDLRRVATLASIAAGSLHNAQLFEEVTEVKNYNESVLKSLSNGVVVLDSEGFVSKVNPAACQILRIPENEIVGKPLAELVDTDSKWLTKATRAVMHSAKPENHLDCKVHPLGQTAVALNLTLEPLLDSTERAIGNHCTEYRKLCPDLRRYARHKAAPELNQPTPTLPTCA